MDFALKLCYLSVSPYDLLSNKSVYKLLHSKYFDVNSEQWCHYCANTRASKSRLPGSLDQTLEMTAPLTAVGLTSLAPDKLANSQLKQLVSRIDSIELENTDRLTCKSAPQINQVWEALSHCNLAVI